MNAGEENIIIHTGLRAEFNKLRPKNARKFLCHAPFHSLRFSQAGKILACCYNRGFVLGQYPEQTLHDIWFGDKIRQFRDFIRKNDLTHGCDECAERLNHRLFHLSGIRQYDYLATARKSRYPSMFDFEISNICNLECIMCLGENSSAIRSRREKLPPYTQHYDSAFVHQLEEFIPYLKEARFSGGEPFLIPLYFEIWERIIALNPETEISVLTNATILDESVKALLKKGNFSIAVSADSLVKETYEKIRQGADFEMVMHHFSYFMEYSRERKKTFSLNVCPLPQNWNEIPSLVKFCNEQNIQLVLHTVIFPPAQSLRALSAAELKNIYQHLSRENLQGFNECGQKNMATYFCFLQQIAGWIKEAEKREQQKEILSGKTETELWEQLKLHLKNGKAEEYVQIAEILQDAEFNAEARKNILINLLCFPAALIISEIKHSIKEKIRLRLKMFNY